MIEVGNLTTMEVDALTDVDGGLNLTDGHARLVLSGHQAAIVARIPEMFAEASRRPFPDIEREAHATFLKAIGQHGAPVGTGRILSCYSSTLATDIVARALPAGSTIAVLHPTFDNIADLFATRGLKLVPLAEEELLDMRWPGPPVGAIVVTHPNNPTGLVTPKAICARSPSTPYGTARSSSWTPASAGRCATRSTTPTPSSTRRAPTGS